MSHTCRRSFLRRSAVASAVLTFAGPAPSVLTAGAVANTSQRILVVIELAGGNDGLNTVVPYLDATYQRLRPKLALKKSDVLDIGNELGLHPSLSGFADLLEAGRLSIIQGVGYPEPNRSHFESMDIWHTCQRKDEVRTDGWLGRMLETSESTGTDPGALHLGHDKQPFALMANTVRVPSIRSLDEFRLKGADDAQFKKAVQELADARRGSGNGLLDFVQSSTSSALAASERLESSGKSYSSAVTYPDTDLARKLQTIARLINSGLSTSVYYIQLDGFDTHAQQADAHQGLLRQLGDGVKAFFNDLDELKQSDRVALMCFSEFGRRVEENASEGTDHGTAGPMFVLGTSVNAGLVGKQPSLSSLQDGDLKHHTDFRQVYATLLKNWFNCDPSAVLKGAFDSLPVFRA